jgi:hypothetical protein
MGGVLANRVHLPNQPADLNARELIGNLANIAA